MSALSELSSHLKAFWALPQHDNPKLAEKLKEVQDWQRQRLAKTHSELFSQPKNKPMANYFLHYLYGGNETLVELAKQLDRIVPKAQKVEKLVPSSALETGTMAINTSITATELDVHVAQWLLENDLPVNEENMLSAYKAVNDEDARRAQIGELKEVCYRTDKYLNSFILKKVFKVSKKKAYQHNLNKLYDFVGAGLDAMKPLKSVSVFIEPFCERELEIIDDIHR